MNAGVRREELMKLLEGAERPVSATALARTLSVSRQIIVGDIALLRAAGANIVSTPRGYLVPREVGGRLRTLVCRHSAAELEPELNIMVDNGCTVLDVVIEHAVYGQLTGQLLLANRHDVAQFMERILAERASPLSALTGGVHLHTLLCPDEEAYERTVRELDAAGILFVKN